MVHICLLMELPLHWTHRYATLSLNQRRKCLDPLCLEEDVALGCLVEIRKSFYPFNLRSLCEEVYLWKIFLRDFS